MKYIGKILSKRGHNEADFLLTLSDRELDFIKRLLKSTNKRNYIDGSRDYNTLLQLRKSI